MKKNTCTSKIKRTSADYIRQLVTMSMMAAISIVLVVIVHFPIFPIVGFLEYDLADIPLLICSFLYGPVWGVVLTAVVSVIQGFTVSAASGIYGIIMHIIATGTLVLVSGLIYRFKRSRKMSIVALLVGSVSMALIMIPANIFITPYFMGVPRQTVISLLPYIIAFNFIKAIINSVITFITYKPLRRHVLKDNCH